MIPAAVGILSASLLGSVHCAAMCGGFTCVYADASGASGSGAHVADAHRPTASTLQGHLLYNVGRLTSYLFLGALAGTLGAGITHAGALRGIQQGATLVASLLMIVWGATTLAAHLGIRTGGHPRAPLWWQQQLGGLLVRLRQRSVAVRALGMGLATTLLPCGWLYVFVTAAGGTGSIRDGMLLMALFWLGTVPALLTVAVSAQSVLAPFRRTLPALSSVVVLLIGALTLTGRFVMDVGAHTHVH